MRKIVTFFKTTILGGAFAVLPAWLAVLLLLKILMHLEVFVKPVSTHLPEGVGHPRVVAIMALIALCFAVGALIRTTVGQTLKRVVEVNALERLPGYTTLRSVAQQIGELEENRGFKPALVEIEGALAPGFIVEEHAGARCTVFLPSAPTPAAGTILIIDAARVHPVNVPVTTLFKCVTKWGASSGELLAAIRANKPALITDSQQLTIKNEN